MKVLVFCPLHPKPPRLWGRTVQSIFRLDWPYPIDWDFVAGDNPHAEPYDNVTHVYNRARARVLQEGYDALLAVESDMIVPRDALTRLVATGADVAYGLYVWRHGRRLWSAYTLLEERHGESISADWAAAQAAWGTVIDVAGVGLGCTLIRRQVLEAIPFRAPEDHLVSCDWTLALDAQAAGFTQRCDLGVVCGHQTTSPWPQILWPSSEVKQGYLSEPLVPLRVLEPGEKVEIPLGMGTLPIYAMPRSRQEQDR